MFNAPFFLFPQRNFCFLCVIKAGNSSLVSQRKAIYYSGERERRCREFFAFMFASVVSSCLQMQFDEYFVVFIKMLRTSQRKSQQSLFECMNRLIDFCSIFYLR